MSKKFYISFFLCFTLSFSVFSQVSIKDSTISTALVYATYSYQFPQGGLASLFGSNSSIGGGFLFKTKHNWIFGAEGNYLFGGTVKNQDSLLAKISTSDGFVIDANGYYADILFSERGYSFFGKFGKLFPVLSPNPNSGITILAGVGYIEDKIRIHNPQNTAPQVYGDYKKGYDRLNSGLAITGSIGYLYMSNTRLLNAYLGFEFTQTWTTFRRDRNFDTGMKDTSKPSTQFYGIKVKWIIPLYRRTPREYYYY
jgi:hypothetical protein